MYLTEQISGQPGISRLIHLPGRERVPVYLSGQANRGDWPLVAVPWAANKLQGARAIFDLHPSCTPVQYDDVTDVPAVAAVV